MAAPQIPNLNSLRRGRGGSTVRGRGGYPPAPSSEADKTVNDKIVQQTDLDAAVSRLSAVEVGYLDDPFAKYFVSEGHGQRRLPIINRGTYVRTKAIDNLVEEFVDNDPLQKKQIISLGAGTDTRFYRLMSRHRAHTGLAYERSKIIYHEVDFPENTIKKLHPPYKESELCRFIEPPCSWSKSLNDTDLDAPYDGLDAENYHVHPVDLRSLDPSRSPPRSFDFIEKALPTLIISECCLCYLAPAAADTVALYFTNHLFPSSTPLGLLLYEPINPNDSFGRVMVSNLAARGIVLQTLKKYGSLEAQDARMKGYGLDSSAAATINTLWDKGVNEIEKERVSKLEMVDEVEEWELLADHYCVAWGWKGIAQVWSGWKRMTERMH